MDSGSLKKLTGLEEEAISDVPAAIIALNIKIILVRNISHEYQYL